MSSNTSRPDVHRLIQRRYISARSARNDTSEPRHHNAAVKEGLPSRRDVGPELRPHSKDCGQRTKPSLQGVDSAGNTARPETSSPKLDADRLVDLGGGDA